MILQNDTAIYLASGSGRYLGVLWKGASDSRALWLEQILHFQDGKRALLLAKQVVMARVAHLREVLRQSQWGEVPVELDSIQQDLENAVDLDQLRGMEGYAARLYFEQIANALPAEFGFEGRNRRPPRDPFNVLLSLGYTVLYGYSDTLLRSVGLFPWEGFYHRSHGSHAALASDLMEPFRHIVERTAMSLLLHHRIRRSEFQWRRGDQQCGLQAGARRRFLTALAARFESPVKGRAGGEALPLMEHLRRQALSLRKEIRGEGRFEVWRMR